MIREQDNLLKVDRRSRLGRWASACRSPNVPTEGPIASQRGGQARFDEGLGRSSRRACQPDTLTRICERKGTGDHRDDSVYQQGESNRGEILPIP